MIAVIKANGNKVTGRAAEVFVKIGIAEELKEGEPVATKITADAVPKEQLKAIPVTKARQSKKTKRGRQAKKK